MPYVQLPAPHLDSIACTKLSPHEDSLMVTTHDGAVLLYRCQTPEREIAPKLMSKFHSDAAVASLAFTQSRKTFAGLLDGTVRELDHENMKLSAPLYGSESDQISEAIGHISAVNGNLIVAGSYSGRLIWIDSRTYRPVHELATLAKIFAMDTTSTNITVGQAQQQVQIFDIRRPELPAKTRPSGLKFQITSLQSFPNEQGYALSSLDGRVSVEYYDELPQAQQQKFAFKCHRHRDKQTGTDSVFPVTALRFHKQTNTLITSGADGHVCLWDWQRRKRTKQFAALENQLAISHMDVSHDGAIMVVGANDDQYLRAKDYGSEMKGGKVYVRSIMEK